MVQQQIIELLKYKKQIILQGPPGTGKTRLAKEIASEISNQFALNENNIADLLKVNDRIPSVIGETEYKVDNVNDNKVILSRNGIQNKNISFQKILQFYNQNDWKQSVSNGDDRGAYAIAYFIYKKKQQSEQVKIIQFHPSYSYEDFVRGIVSKPNETGEGIIYDAENKILGEFAKIASQNFQASKNSTYENLETKFTLQLKKFADEVREGIDKDGEFKLGDDTTAKIVGITDGAFIYSFDKRKDIKYSLLFSDLIKIENYPKKVLRTMDVRDMEDGYLKMKGKHAYYFKAYNLIKGMQTDDSSSMSNKSDLKNYVLIIDEINRANLSSVLGELIYALEYRNEAVESMYEVEGSNKLSLPPNIYIIGTMNTADRSVGHIDYAIRRRFAFVDILPKNLGEELGADFKSDIFGKVYKLFYDEQANHLSSEFKPEQVCLGHSYFIQQYEKDNKGNDLKDKPIDFKLRLQYEIVPILEEYIKDGVLKESAKEIIDELKHSNVN